MSNVTEVQAQPRRSLSQIVTLAGIGFAALLIIVQIGFFLRPGPLNVLMGISHHVFVLAILLLLTARTRTVSVATLGLFWLLGVWLVTVAAIALQWPMAMVLGWSLTSPVPLVWVPLVDVVVMLAPVAAYYFVMSRGNDLQPSAGDGLLIGFAVGAGYAFHEDAIIGHITLSGAGWLSLPPWSLIAPTITPVGNGIALNHALWGAVAGLTFGVAMMLRHHRLAWAVALIGPVLAAVNHGLLNFVASDMLLALGRGSLPLVPGVLHNLTLGGVLPLLVIFVGGLGIVLAEWRILSWVSAREPAFAPMPTWDAMRRLAVVRDSDGVRTYLAMSHYNRFRRLVYYAAWRAERAGAKPSDPAAMLAGLLHLRRQVSVEPAAQAEIPFEATV